MKWRCPQCGKPQEHNDPPCDNCGHHTFERAVVPAAPETDHESFVWVCSACGRTHQRNNPPCSRCGNAMFEKEPLEYEAFDTSTRSYLDLLGRVELAGIAVVFVLLLIGALGITGVVSVPGLTPQAAPTVENVPGNATVVDGMHLGDAETAYLAGVDEARRAADLPTLSRDRTLENLATFYNQHRVKTVYGNGTLPSEAELREHFRLDCRARLLTPEPVALSDVAAETGESLGDELAVRLTGSNTFRRSATRTGLDIHAAPDGRLYVTQVAC